MNGAVGKEEMSPRSSPQRLDRTGQERYNFEGIKWGNREKEQKMRTTVRTNMEIVKVKQREIVEAYRAKDMKTVR